MRPELDGRPVVASAGNDSTVRVWDPADAEATIAVHTGHTRSVLAVCALELDGRPVVASAGNDSTVGGEGIRARMLSDAAPHRAKEDAR